MAKGARLKYLFDTNIWAFASRDDKLWKLIQFDVENNYHNDLPLTNIVVKAELMFLAKKWKWGPKKILEAEQKLQSCSLVNLTSKLIPFYVDLDLFSYKCKPSRKMGKNDLWIAATAMATGATLITADKDFNILGGDKINLIQYNHKDLTSLKKMKK